MYVQYSQVAKRQIGMINTSITLESMIDRNNKQIIANHSNPQTENTVLSGGKNSQQKKRLRNRTAERLA